MWTYSTPHTLCSVGIDSEKIERFEKILGSCAYPMPFVFSSREIDHARSSRYPAQSLCASFCFKEAVLKALGQPYNFDSAEFLLDESHLERDVVVNGLRQDRQEIDRFRVQVILPEDDSNELTVVVHALAHEQTGVCE